MWFATEDGLNKYDGYDFTIYRPDLNDPTSISDLGIRKLFVDSRGYLWIISLNGDINRFVEEKNNFVNYNIYRDESSDRIKEKIISISENSSGNLWVGTNKGSLYQYNHNSDKFILKKDYNYFQELYSEIHLQTLFIDSENIIWIGTWDGIIKFDLNNERPEMIRHQEGTSNTIAGNMVFDIVEDEEKNLWFACVDGGLSKFNKQTEKFYNYRKVNRNNSICSNRISSLLLNKDELWIGSIDNGLSILNTKTKKFTNCSHNPSLPNSLSSGAIFSFTKDVNGGIWIGTFGGGINKFYKKFQNFSAISYNPNQKNSISNNPVLAICGSIDGGLWIGTDGGGLNYLSADRSFVKKYFMKDGLRSNSVTAILLDSKKKVMGRHRPRDRIFFRSCSSL